MEYDYKGYVIRSFTREVQVYRLSDLRCLAHFHSLDEAMRWIDETKKTEAF